MLALKDVEGLTVYNGTEDKYSENDDGRLLPDKCCGGGGKGDVLAGGEGSQCEFLKMPENWKGLHCWLLLGEPIESFLVDDKAKADDLKYLTPGFAEYAVRTAIEVMIRGSTNLEEVLGKTHVPELPSDSETIYLVISLLRTFIQLNFTGPDISCPTLKRRLEELEELSSGPFQEVVKKLVEADGIETKSSVQQPVLLLLANYFLSSMATPNNIPMYPFYLIWRFRVDFLRQRVLTRRSWSLGKRLKYFAEEYLNWAAVPNHLMPGLLTDLHGSFLCEISEMLMFYYDGLLSERILEEAEKVFGLTIDFSGKMGFRTKFQQTPKAQTVVDIVLEPGAALQEVKRAYPSAESRIPRSEALNDETRLERLRLLDETTEQSYRDVHQLVLLGKMLLRRDFQNSDLKLHEEEAIINAILDCPINWSGRISALVARCEFEKNNIRTVDRCLRQLEEILKFIARRMEAKDEVFRQYLFFGSGHPMKCEIKVEFGEVLLRLNHWKEALNVYQELGSFEHVVRCYEMVDLRHKAEKLIREKIAESGKTPKLLVLLGDVTYDISYYNEAWTLSSEKSLDSQIRLGNYYFKREEFPDAIVHLKRVVELAPLEYPSWLRLAWAYYKIEEYDPAFQAYLRAGNLEYDNFQVWNNLANCALKLNRKDYALRAYKVAVKCHYDEWRVWSNILIVATELNELTDAIQAYHRVLDLNKSYIDEGVLERLVDFASSKPITSVLDPLTKLFGRITTMTSRSPIVWLLYGRLLAAYIDGDEKGAEDSVKSANFERAMFYYNKALMMMRQNPRWKTDLDMLHNVVKCIKEFRECRERGRAIISSDANDRLKGTDATLKQTATAVHEHISKLNEESVTKNEKLISIFEDLVEERKNSFYA